MTEPGNANQPGASGGEPAQTTPTTPEPKAEPTPAPIAPTAKVEVKDGAVVVDGKKFVAESDLIAAKKSLEGKLEQAQTAHETAINTAKLEASNAQQEVATLNAKIKENEEARKSGAVSDEDAARVKQELETAKGSVETLQKEADKALEYRRAMLVMQYGVDANTIAEKDMTSLDSFEEALKAVSTAKGGVGNYAVGGGTGEAAPESNMDRAAKILANTPMRGVRNNPEQT